MKRLLPGILLASGWLLLLVFGGHLLFWLVVFAITFLGGREYCRMAFVDQLYESDRIILPLLFTVPVISALFFPGSPASTGLGLLVGLAGLIGYVISFYARFDNPVTVLTRGVLGLVFIGFLAAHLVFIRGMAVGDHWLILLTAITAGSDTGAYFIGSRFGRRKLCPRISPAKTVEGGLGGIGGGIFAALLLTALFPVPAGPQVVVVLAFFLSIVAMTGDLLESIIKRGYGVKDSGTLLGGHGGVLDRLDSLFLAGPIFFYSLLLAGIR